MATFPSINPSFGQRKVSRPNANIVKFADGYEQRQMIGIAAHKNGKEYILKFENITETESDTIETFLDARAIDQESFDFTAPGELAAQKFVCSNWSKTINFANRATISATFREVFEP